MHKLNCSYFLSDYISVNLYVLFSLILLLGVSVYFLFVDKIKGWGRVGLILIFIGGALNLTERVLTGCVKDYLNFFGIFYYNIFVLFVSSGIAVFGFSYFRNHAK